MNLREKYGEWGIVCGGSVGMGGAYCDRLAKEGLNVVVTGRHQDTVDAKCGQLEADYGVKTMALVIDLGDEDAYERIIKVTENLEMGVLVYNAGLANIELFHDRDISYELYRLNVNVRSMLALTLWYSKQMMSRKRGAIIISSSDGGIIGAPYIQTYSATKAYGLMLAESMWGEMQGTGVDVLAVLPGNTIGQNYSDVAPGTPGFQTGAEVVEEAFAHLGDYPCWISGQENRDRVKEIFDVELRKKNILFWKEIMADIRDTYADTEGDHSRLAEPVKK